MPERLVINSVGRYSAKLDYLRLAFQQLDNPRP